MGRGKVRRRIEEDEMEPGEKGQRTEYEGKREVVENWRESGS